MGGRNQLLMYIAGVGGTGKSHVVHAIVKLFNELGCKYELMLGAPTTNAAILIGDHALHSLLMLPDE
jgi:predicted AAA+ superfamily ATPase